jgi:hypothetical protein
MNLSPSIEQDYSDIENDLIETYSSLLRGHNKAWVLFQFGTCVILRKETKTPEKDAKELMTLWGIPVAGTPSHKFSVTFLSDQGIPGCLVGCHHPDIMTFVSPTEIPSSAKISDAFEGIKFRVGCFGRKKRQWDVETLKVIHVGGANDK